MTVLITGGAGLLGRTLIALAPAGTDVQATQRTTPVSGATAHVLDLADAGAVRRAWAEARPRLVIHTAYGTQEGERDVWQATRNVVDACAEGGAELIHMSTDALLGGEDAPYDESAEAAPVHEYGRWKARAEAYVRERLPAAAVVRTSLITQLDPPDPRCAWVADSLRAGRPVTLFVDEMRCPILVEDLAAQLWEIAALAPHERAGVWNLGGPEAVSRYTLGVLIAAHAGLDPAGITAAPSSDSPSPRPRDLRLTTARADRQLSTRARPVGAALLRGG